MSTDFRALCAELTDVLAELPSGTCEELVVRARAALAQPQGEGPSDQELEDLADQFWVENSVNFDEEHYAFARAVLARWGRPAPVPAEVEVGALIQELRDAAFDRNGSDPDRAMLTRAADIITRLALQPVPVSERLPGPEDCAPWPKDSDASAWCWMGKEVDGGWEWEQRSAGYLVAFPGDFTHWLPAHALPLPAGEVAP